MQTLSNAERDLQDACLGQTLKHIKAIRPSGRKAFARIKLRRGQDFKILAGEGWALVSCMINTFRVRPEITRATVTEVGKTQVLTLYSVGGYKVCELIMLQDAAWPTDRPFHLKDMDDDDA